MPRILVTTNEARQNETAILLDERVLPVHLSDGHSAEQLVERLGWALSDAEELEAAGPARGPAAARCHPPARNGGATSFSPGTVAAKLRV
jgi:hypothetical protein